MSKRKTRKGPPDVPPAQTFYTGEPDIEFLCRDCHELGVIPVHFMRVDDRYRFEGEMSLLCPRCKGAFPVEPRRELAPDGSTLLWIDRTVLDEYIPPTEIMSYALRDKRTGEIVEISMSSNDNVFWATCNDCGLPFRARGDFAITVAKGARLKKDDLVTGPCEHCGGFGSALLHRAQSSGFVTYASSPVFADQWLATLAEQLQNGNIDIPTAAKRLRATQRLPLARLADWMEQRPVTVAAAGTVLTVAASLIGPQLAASPQPQQPSMEQPVVQGYSEEEVTELLEKVLDHYDETHGLKAEHTDPQQEQRR